MHRVFSLLRWTPVGIVVHDHFFGITTSPLHTESASLSDPYHISSDDKVILYRRTNSFRNHSLVIFNTPSNLLPGSAVAVGRVTATSGDLIYDDNGHFQIVQSGQVSLSHQLAHHRATFSDLSATTTNERLEESSRVIHGEKEEFNNSDRVSDSPSPNSDFNGFVPTSIIEGEAIAILWPPSKIRILK
jgi:hypothetical protein